MMWLSSDHTGGPTTPESGVADNDLATGEIVDTISHSKYWPQNWRSSWSRTTARTVPTTSTDTARRSRSSARGPSTARSINTYYFADNDGPDVIEQILGAQPLNQKLAAATPMYGAFTNKPNYTPFTAVPNQVPLTEAISTAPSCGLDTLGRTGAAARALNKAEAQKTAVPANERATAAAPQTWIKGQHTMGNGAIPDYANPEQMNRYTWYESHDWKVPYPGDSKIYTPSQVPMLAYIPSTDAGPTSLRTTTE